MVIDVLERDDLPFPGSLPEFQHLLPDGDCQAGCRPDVVTWAALLSPFFGERLLGI